MKVTNSNKKNISTIAFGVVFSILFFGVFFVFPVDAVWIEPGQPAPQGNVARPLNIQTGFSGNSSLIEGSYYDYDKNEMTLYVKGCDAGQTLMWAEDDQGFGDWQCRDLDLEVDDLLSVLEEGSDARAFSGDIYMGGAENAANLYVGGGEMRSKWIHATSTEGQNTIASDLIISGLVGINTDNPQATLDVTGDIRLGDPDSSASGLIFNGDSDGFDKIFAVDDGDETPDILAYWNENNDFILDQGNMGIGTDNPHTKLQVLGQAMFGSSAEIVDSSENLLYGSMDGSSEGNFVLMQKESSDRFKVDHYGVTTANDFCLADGSVCLSTGLQFVGITSGIYTGDVGGYLEANRLCQTDVNDSDPDNHVCTTHEIQGLIRTNNFPRGVYGWINAGPPGYTARANDCDGWINGTGVSGSDRVYGAYWTFDATGGRGFITSCNVELSFICCR